MVGINNCFVLDERRAAAVALFIFPIHSSSDDLFVAPLLHERPDDLYDDVGDDASDAGDEQD